MNELGARLEPWLRFLRYAMAGQDVYGSLILGLIAVAAVSVLVAISAKAAIR